MKPNWLKNTLIASGLVGTGLLLSQFTTNGTNQNVDVRNHVYLGNNIAFCGEKVPLDIIDVKERLDREMTTNINLHSSTTLIIKRANRYFPVIEPILKKNGIPDDFKYLCVIESALANATSPAGAKGFWQFMPETAREYNLEVSSTVDERYDVVKATEAASQYLLRAYNKFGNWTLVAAAYNRGMAGIDRQIMAQSVSSYYDMYLNEETSRYVFRILALKEIMQNASKYGYELPKDVLYRPIKTRKVTINNNIPNLAQYAISEGINYKILKLHNPWLQDTSLTVQPGKTYQIEIPTEGYGK